MLTKSVHEMEMTANPQVAVILFCDAPLLTQFGLFHALSVFFGFSNQWLNGCWLIVIIQSDINEVGGVGVCAFTGDGIFRDDLDFCFERGASSVGDFCGESDQVTDADRFTENERIYGDSDDASLCMTHTSKCAGFIHQLHDPTTVDVAVIVGMFGLHQLR